MRNPKFRESLCFTISCSKRTTRTVDRLHVILPVLIIRSTRESFGFARTYDPLKNSASLFFLDYERFSKVEYRQESNVCWFLLNFELPYIFIMSDIGPQNCNVTVEDKIICILTLNIRKPVVEMLIHVMERYSIYWHCYRGMIHSKNITGLFVSRKDGKLRDSSLRVDFYRNVSRIMF